MVKTLLRSFQSTRSSNAILALRQRNEAFITWRQVTEARNAARHESDINRYRRLELLAQTAWQRYERRCEQCRLETRGI
jgi:hypothetical protein